jgi:hypothetical protein
LAARTWAASKSQRDHQDDQTHRNAAFFSLIRTFKPVGDERADQERQDRLRHGDEHAVAEPGEVVVGQVFALDGDAVNR